jgi:hypothetical protein
MPMSLSQESQTSPMSLSQLRPIENIACYPVNYQSKIKPWVNIDTYSKSLILYLKIIVPHMQHVASPVSLTLVKRFIC